MPTDPSLARIRARIEALESLVSQWESEGDADARWSLYLLTEAIDMERATLRQHLRDPGPTAHPQEREA